MKVETLWVLSPVAWCAGSVLAALTLRRKIPWQMWGIAIIAKTLVVSFAGFSESGAVEAHTGLDAQAIPAASQVEQLDIGQGDAALIQSEKWGGVGLIDAGSRLALNPSEWFTLFAQRKIRHLDFIVLSHLDEDHSGGALRLAALIPVRCVQTSRLQWESPRGIQLAAALQARGVRVADHEAGCFPYRVYGPKEIAPSAEKNGAMSAFWVPLERGGGYFGMGDADETDERGFLGRALDDIQHPLILKISHHGSRTSTSAVLLQKLAPERAWISCGIGNHFGHPTSRVLHLLEESHIPVERTDLQGVLTSATL